MKLRQFLIDSVSDWEKITDCYPDYRNSNNLVLLFRGQNRDTYKLKPSLCRNDLNINDLEDLERRLFEEFFEEIDKANLSHAFKRKNPVSSFETDWYKIIQAQHVGLPTRLLDWTPNSDIALYFATCTIERDDDSFGGQFWIYACDKKDFWEYDRERIYQSLNPFEIKDSYVINPSFQYASDYKRVVDNSNRFLQGGRFTIQSLNNSILELDKQSIFKDKIFMNLITPKAKREIREKISSRLNSKTLFRKVDKRIEDIVKYVKNNNIKNTAGNTRIF